MKEGIVRVVIFYGIGLGLTGLTYLIFGPALGHGPGPYIIIPFLTFLIGLFWTASTFRDYYFKNKTDQRKGIIYSNIIIIIILLLTIFYARSQMEYPDIGTINQDEMNASHSGDTTSIMYNGKIIYLKVKDSVFADRRDSLIETRDK